METVIKICMVLMIVGLCTLILTGAVAGVYALVKVMAW